MNTLPQTTATNKPASVCEIIRLHGEIITAARTSLDKAIRIGELLTQEKVRLDHGQWLPWLKANVPFTDRTARNYIRVYEHRDRLKLETVSDLTAAYRQLAPPPDDEPETKTADQLFNGAMQLFGEAHDLLKIECERGDLSPENAAALTRALAATKNRVEGMLQNSSLPFSKLLFVVTTCNEMESILKFRSAA